MLEPFRIPPDADQLLLQPIRYARALLRIAQGRMPQAADALLVCADLGAWPAENPSFIAWRSRLALVLAGLGQRDRAGELAAEELGLARDLGNLEPLGSLSGARVDRARQARSRRAGRGGHGVGRTSARLVSPSADRLWLGAAAVGAPRRRRAPLCEGLDLAHTCGATVLAQTAHQELLASGARPRRRALRGRDALTPTEARIVDMAAQGHSTPQIAQALFVTTKTVETHLGHAYRKLDIHSRDELAAALSRRESSGHLERAALRLAGESSGASSEISGSLTDAGMSHLRDDRPEDPRRPADPRPRPRPHADRRGISSEQHPTRQFHGWLELTAAIDALRTAHTAPAACRHASVSPRPSSQRDQSR